MVSEVKRVESVRIRLAGDMKDRLMRLGTRLGVPAATLCAVAIGQWVSNQEASLGAVERSTTAIAEQMGKVMEEQLKLFVANDAGSAVKDAA